MSEDSTVDVNRELGSADFLRTGLELVMEQPGQAPRRLPVCQLQTTLGGETADLPAPGLKAVLRYQEGRVFFTNLTPSSPAHLNGQPVGFCELTQDGPALELGELRLRLVSAQEPWRGALECYTEPYLGRFWGLCGRSIPIGRPGRRANRIELSHRTVSRQHATLLWDEGFQLVVEEGATAVNGQVMESQATISLADGDLIRLGELLFRLRTPAARGPEAAPPTLRIHCLQRFEVFRGEERLGDRVYRSHTVRFLLALISSLGPQSNERLLELFWPDEPPEKARRSLTWAVSTLRGCLKPGDYLERTSSFLQMNPAIPCWNDYAELDRLLREGQRASLEMALELYRGPYMPDCYQDWAVELQDRLSRRVQEAGLTVLEAHLAEGRHEAVLRWGRQLLALDPCCQPAYLAMMKACLAQGRAEEALRLFEQARRKLDLHLGLEPSTDLLRERQRALLQ